MSTSNPNFKYTDAAKHFDAGASNYEKMTGGCTRRIAEYAIKQLPPITSDTKILDSACGPGIVTKLILEKTDEAPNIVGIDFAPGMIELFDKAKDTYGWKNVESHVMDAQKLDKFADESFDSVIMNFGIFTLPDAVEGAKEIKRVLKKGGIALITTWKLSRPTEIMEEVVASIRPDSVDKILPVSKEWMKSEKLKQTLIDGGFSKGEIDIEEYEDAWRSESKEQFAEVMSGPFWAKIREGWSDEQNARWKMGIVEKLGDIEDGPVSVPMIAWIGTARKG